MEELRGGGNRTGGDSHMGDFRRSAFRILLLTCFLLLIAWVSLKLMQYRGDTEALLNDLQNTGAARFVKEKAVPFIHEKLAPAVEKLSAPVKEFLNANLNTEL